MAAAAIGALAAPMALAGPLGNASFHHGFHNSRGSETADAIGDRVSGQIGADTIRIHIYWNGYQTGVGQYSQAYLDKTVVDRIRAARKNSDNANVKALVQFDLPGGSVPWMEASGYQLINPTQSGGSRRFYPTTGSGLAAYGQAAAKALKYLHGLGISSFLETPNEPNLTNGPSDPVDATKIGQMAGNAVSYAAAEGLQLNPNSGPAILVGAVSAGQSGAGHYQYATAKEYFQTVQWWTDYTIEQWWANAPNGPSYAKTLMGTWRPSFHAYPGNGGNEVNACETLKSAGEGRPYARNQDQLGDLTGEAAFYSVLGKVTPLAEAITNGKRWWITETGMSSFKTNKEAVESVSACLARRSEGGSTYGKAQQSDFYKRFVDNFNYFNASNVSPYARFEGVAFFEPVDTTGRQFAGYGVHWAGDLQKPAAVTFHNYYGSEQPMPPTWHGPDDLGGSSTTEPAVSSSAPGILNVFQNFGGHLYHRSYTSSGWSLWESLGGPTIVGGPSAVSWGPGRVDVVARTTSNQITHWWYDGTWHSGDNLGGSTESDPAISSSASGILNVFLRGPENRLYHRWHTSSGWSNGWESLGGTLLGGPDAVSWGPGRVDVVGRTTNNQITHWWYDGTWHSGDNLGGETLWDPSISSSGSGELNVFATNPGNHYLYQKWFNFYGWSTWNPVGGYFKSGVDSVSWDSKRIDVVGVSSTDTVEHWWFGK